jgi:hypothetical protein
MLDFIKKVIAFIIERFCDKRIVVAGSGTIDRLFSQRCKNGSYRKSFIIRYDDCYRDFNGDVVHVNMHQNVEGFNEVARKMREFSEGDNVMFTGVLKSRETEHYTVHYIEIENAENIIRLPEEI